MNEDNNQQTLTAPKVLENSNSSVVYAGFWKRFLAYWVDSLVLSIISIPISIPFVVAALGTNKSTVNPITSLLGLFIAVGYFVFFWVHQNGQTLGHRLLALRVVREDGKPMDVGTAILRYVGYIISSILFFLGFFWVAWDSKKQGFHDKIARTVVVKTEGKSHTLVAVLLFIIPVILYILLIVGLIFITVYLKTNADKVEQQVNSGASYQATYPLAVSTAINKFRLEHNLPAMTEKELLCTYAHKRLGELKLANGFDEHQGFIEDTSDKYIWTTYFSEFGSASEFYGSTADPSTALSEVNSWGKVKGSLLADASYVYGCVRSDDTYTVFILATGPKGSPTPAAYYYPTLPPYATPTLSAAAQAQLDAFYKSYNSAKATIAAPRP